MLIGLICISSATILIAIIGIYAAIDENVVLLLIVSSFYCNFTNFLMAFLNYVFQHSILLALLAIALAALMGFTRKIDAGLSNVIDLFLSSRSSVLKELEALNGTEDFIHNTDNLDNIISTVTKLAKILQSRRFLSHQLVYFGIGSTLIALQVF